MKKYLRIMSKGVIDTLSFSLLGGTTKDNDSSKIGMWGSGLKYAIASMLRNGLKFRAFAGKEEVLFTLVDKPFRGETFKVIAINGVETSLTTKMGGKDWDNEFAPIREVYSNALDEDQEAIIGEYDNMMTKEGYTSFFIEMNPVVADFFQNIGSYFCRTNVPLEVTGDVSIYPAKEDGLRLFRKGILCKFDDRKKSLFNYDSDYFDINEARVLKSDWEAAYHTAKGWGNCKNVDLIQNLIQNLQGNSEIYEWGLDWSYAYFSEAWNIAVAGKRFCSAEHAHLFNASERAGAIILPFAMLKRLKGFYDSVSILGMDSAQSPVYAPVVQEIEEVKNKADEAMAILAQTVYAKRLGTPTVEFVNFADPYILAQAKDKKIHLSVKLDSKTPMEIAKIIIEEQEHLITGFHDKTREFQDHLFDLYFNQLEENRKLREKLRAMDQLKSLLATIQVEEESK